MNSRLSGSIERILKIDLSGARAAFLWGPRQVGKTTLLRQQFAEAKYYDLLSFLPRKELSAFLLAYEHRLRDLGATLDHILGEALGRGRGLNTW